MVHFWKKVENFVKKTVTKLFVKKMHYKKNPTYFARESNFEYTFKISDRSVKICSSYVSGRIKKSGFEKNAFKVLSTVKFGHLDIFSVLYLLICHF